MNSRLSHPPSLPQTLELKVVVEPTVLSEKLIEEDSDFPLKELQTWGQSECFIHHRSPSMI